MLSGLKFTPKLTLSLPFGALAVELPTTEPFQRHSTWRTEHRFKRVCDLAHETTAALRAGDLARAVERLLAVADEFPAADRRDAILMSHRLATLDDAEGLINPDTQSKKREELVADLMEALAKYRSDAELATHSDDDVGFHPDPDTVDATMSEAARARSEEVDPDAAIHCQSLGWRVRDRWILRDVSFQLRRGSIVGVLGRNGAGKTSLLRLLAQDVPPAEGLIRFPDLSGRVQPFRRLRDRISYVRQEPTSYVGQLENHLRRFAVLRGIHRDDLDDEVSFVMERFQLSSHRHAEWSELSGGFRTRVDLARSLLASPDILILDEPLGPLDSASQREYLAHLKDIAASRRGVCIIITSQDVHAVTDVADHMIVISEGRMSFAGAPGELPGFATGKAFEFAGKLDFADLELALSRLPGAKLIDRGTTRMLLADATVTATQALDALIEGGETIHYFRDVSRSPQWLLELPHGDPDA
jgi:ABC-type multidrug transport system ATPase subunit